MRALRIRKTSVYFLRKVPDRNFSVDHVTEFQRGNVRLVRICIKRFDWTKKIEIENPSEIGSASWKSVRSMKSGQKGTIRKSSSSKMSAGEGSTLESFGAWCKRYTSDGGGFRMLMKEYEGIKASPTPALCSCFAQNSALNRYHNIHLVDATRVQLQDGLQPEYIHANFVDGYNNKNAYILTQVSHFSNFCDISNRFSFFAGAERSDRERLLANDLARKGASDRVFDVVERERSRQSRSVLPIVHRNAVPRRSVAFGVVGRQRNSGSSNRRSPSPSLLLVRQNRHRTGRLDGLLRRMARSRCEFYFFRYKLHFLFFQVPQDAGSFLDLLAQVESLRVLAMRSTKGPKDWVPPVVVNCSAGVGRSATFVACQIEIDRLRETGMVDFQGTVRKLRNQRFGAVQNYVQYTFICRVIIEAARRYRVPKER